jgi:hypothetical protein
MTKRKGRHSNEFAEKVRKYSNSFMSHMESIHGSEANQHLEDSSIHGFEGNKRYTNEYIEQSKKRLEINFGNSRVKKYNEKFIEFLKKTYGENEYLNYIENKNDSIIVKEFPDNTRYSQKYLELRKGNSENVKKCRFDENQKEIDQINIMTQNLIELNSFKKEKLDVLLNNEKDLESLNEIINYLKKLVKCNRCERPIKEIGFKNHFKNCLKKDKVLNELVEEVYNFTITLFILLLIIFFFIYF